MALVEEFELSCTTCAGAFVVTVRGDLDLATAPRLRGTLTDLIEGQGARRLVVDLEGLTFIDSAGIYAWSRRSARASPRRGLGSQERDFRTAQGARCLLPHRRLCHHECTEHLAARPRPTAVASMGEAMSAAAHLADHDRRNWRLEAACRSVDARLFFPLGQAGAAEDQIAAAKGVCWQCPVREQCLDYAVATHQQDGIWGGTSEDERRKLRKTWLAERRRGSHSPPSSGPARGTAGQK